MNGLVPYRNNGHQNNGSDAIPQDPRIKSRMHKWRREKYVSIPKAYFAAVFSPNNENKNV